MIGAAHKIAALVTATGALAAFFGVPLLHAIDHDRPHTHGPGGAIHRAHGHHHHASSPFAFAPRGPWRGRTIEIADVSLPTGERADRLHRGGARGALGGGLDHGGGLAHLDATTLPGGPILLVGFDRLAREAAPALSAERDAYVRAALRPEAPTRGPPRA